MKTRLLALLLAFALPAAAVAAPAASRLFVVHFTTGPAWDPALAPPAQKFFKEHSANLARLREEGVLAIGARYADKGMILLRVADEAAARAAFASDPALATGVFQMTVDEFRPFYHGSTQASSGGSSPTMAPISQPALM